MKKFILLLLCITMLISTKAQKEVNKDSTKVEKSDTIRIGGMVIITHRDKNKGPKKVEIKDDSTGQKKEFSFNRKTKKRANISTSFLNLDLGFNNYKDATNYSDPATTSMLRSTSSTSAPTAADFKLNTGKSINVNLWLVMQKLNVIQHVVNLKYGLGLELYNFRFKSPLSFKDATPSYIVKDSISFSKNKLTVKYVTVPLMLTINPTGKNGFSISAGVSASYRYGANNKQKSDARGKDKNRGDYDLSPLKFALVGDIGYSRYRIYGSYSLTPLHEKGLNLTPYSVGIRFHRW
jgi:hypothetical protein